MKIVVVDLTNIESFQPLLTWQSTPLLRGDGLVIKVNNHIEDSMPWTTQSLPNQLIESKSADQTFEVPDFFTELYPIHKHYIAKQLGDGILCLSLVDKESNLKQIIVPVAVQSSLELSAQN